MRFCTLSKHCEKMKCIVCNAKTVILFNGQMPTNSTLRMIAASTGNKPSKRSHNAEYICCTALLCCPLTTRYGMNPNCPVCLGPKPPHVVQESVGGARTACCMCDICNNFCTTRWSVSEQKVMKQTSQYEHLTREIAFDIQKGYHK